MQYRREIDGLRAVAVLAVILFHAGLRQFSGGFVGVDVFFVISGYLITTIIFDERERGAFSLLRFYERRARRILPALFVVLAVCVAVAWLFLVPGDLKTFGRSVVAVSVFASNVLFVLESNYFYTAAELKPLLHTWSLGVEEQYYVFFPLLVLAAWRFGKQWLVAMLVIIAVASLAAAQHGATVQPAATFFLLPTRGWELLIGSFVALYLRRRGAAPDVAVANVASALGLVLVIYSIVAFDSRTPFPSLYALAPTVGAALIIVFSSPQTAVGKLLSTRLFVGIGLVSYSAYLWHQPLVAFASHVVIGGPSLVMRTLLSLSALPLAYLTWRFIEQPFRKRFTRRTIFTLAIFGSLLFVAIGLVTMRVGGRDAPTFDEGGYEACAAAYSEHRPCFFGNVATTKTIVIVGDSHAHQLLATLVAKLGKEYKIAPFICNSCFFGERVRFDRQAEKPELFSQTRTAIDLLAGQSIEAVIRVQRWHGYGLDTDDKVRDTVADAMTFFGVPYKKLIVVGSTANVDYRCHVARQLGKLRFGACQDDAKTRVDNETFIRATQSMSVPPTVSFVYPYQLVDGNIDDYCDNHHLSAKGAELVVDEIRRNLAR